MEKIVFVELGVCSTCGQVLEVEVRESDFHGSAVRVIDAHCGVGGHNRYIGQVTREEFDEASPFETI